MRKFVVTALSLSLVLALALVLTSCTGDTGPAGPTGPAGADGTDGEDATFTSMTISFTGEDAGITGPSTLYTISVPEMTQEIVDDACVLVYINDSTGDTAGLGWILMPFVAASGTESVMFTFRYNLGQVTFAFWTTDTSWPFNSTTWYHFKIIVLTGAVPNQLNLESFEEVENYYRDKQKVIN